MENTKICSRCKVAKPREAFNKCSKNPDGLQYKCRDCQKAIHLANKECRNKRRMERYYKENPKEALPEGMKRCSKCKEVKPMTEQYFGKLSKSSDGFKYSCKECRRKTEYEPNREYLITKQKQWYSKNKKTFAITTSEYKKKNREWYREYDKRYYQENKDLIKQRSKEYMYNRIENDLGFKILQRCRSRLYKAIKGHTKSASTQKLIGCTVEHLLNHLESQFTEGMTWDNYGEWHIDHIKPCSSFNFTKREEQFECFNYKNLQPLWAEDNYRKSDKIGTY